MAGGDHHHFCRWLLPEGHNPGEARARAFPGRSSTEVALALDTSSPKELRVRHGSARSPSRPLQEGAPLLCISVCKWQSEGSRDAWATVAKSTRAAGGVDLADGQRRWNALCRRSRPLPAAHPSLTAGSLQIGVWQRDDIEQRALDPHKAEVRCARLDLQTRPLRSLRQLQRRPEAYI